MDLRSFPMWPVAAVMLVLEVFYFFRGFRCVVLAAISSAQGLARRFLHAADAQAEDPEIASEAASLLAKRRAEAARTVAFAMWTVCALFGAVTISQVFINPANFRAPIILQGIIFFVFSLAGGFPSRIASFGSLIVLHVTVMVLTLFVAILTVDPGDAKLMQGAIVMLLSLLSGGLCLRWRVLAVTNVCLYVGVSLARAREDSTDSRAIIVMEFANLLVKLSLFYAGEYLFDFSTRKEAEARLGKCTQSAVTSLLDMLCDAVVDMDGSLRLKNDFPKLRGMFMLNPARSLQGASLADMIQEGEDRAKFRQMVLRSTEGEDAAVSSMLTVRMRDSVGLPVKMGVYHVPYTAVDGCTHHLVGLREETDPVRAVDRQESAGALGAVLRPDIANALNGDVAHPAKHTRKRSSESGQSEGSGSGRSGRSSLNSVGKLPRVCVYLEAQLPIVEASPRFWKAFGLDAGRIPDCGDKIRTFGEFCNDDGEHIIGELNTLLLSHGNCADHGEASAHPLGEIETVDWKDGDAYVGMRRIWARFLPTDNNHGERRRVYLFVSSRVLPVGSGTAASITPQPLCASTSSWTAKGSLAL